jgi:Rps23 Pro-64 3,4-dihydroxylase Tpa1-like proline 4-hydroxylase
MRHQEITLSCGSKIQVFDDLFSWQQREYFFEFVNNSLYTPHTGASTATNESFSPQMILQSSYGEEDNLNFGLIHLDTVSKYLVDAGKPARTWVNITLPGFWIHQHSDASTRKNAKLTTLMYFASFKWEKHFGGDTIFCNKMTGEKERVVEYIPGRLILFDSYIPHITTITTGHALARYAYVCLFSKENNE